MFGRVLRLCTRQAQAQDCVSRLQVQSLCTVSWSRAWGHGGNETMTNTLPCARSLLESETGYSSRAWHPIGNSSGARGFAASAAEPSEIKTVSLIGGPNLSQRQLRKPAKNRQHYERMYKKDKFIREEAQERKQNEIQALIRRNAERRKRWKKAVLRASSRISLPVQTTE